MAWLDKVIVVVYLLFSIGVGVAARGRQKSAQDYFTASGEIRGGFGILLVGLSIASSLFSAISFVAYPSTVYQNGPAILLTAITFPICWFALRFWFLPRYFAQGGRTPYAIIDARLGGPTRDLTSGMFILMRLSWMSTQIYAPTVLLMPAMGLSPAYFWPVVIAIGAICTFSTTVGGLRGVVATDALQFVLILVGLLFIIGTEAAGLSRGQIAAVVAAKSGLWGQPLRFDFNLTATYSFWTILIGFSFANLSAYTGDQMTLQRYLSLGAPGPAARSFSYNVFGVILVSILLAAVGVLLRAWYFAHPSSGLPAEGDKVLPFFITHQLPVGVTGILIAALLASTIGCITSSINSLAGCITNDFVAPRVGKADPAHLLRIGRVVSLLVGAFSVFGVFLIQRLGSLWEISNKISGVLQGPLMGVIAIACLARRPPGWTVIVGAVSGALSGVLAITREINSIWLTFVTVGVTVGTAYALAGLGKLRRLSRFS